MGVLDDVYEQLNTCAKCGFCHSSCKVYKSYLTESYVPRGRVRLIKAVADGELVPDKEYEEAINSCLLCGECAVACPSGVKPNKLVLAARRDLKLRKGLPFIKKAAFTWTLPNPRYRELAFKSFKAFRKMILERIDGVEDFRGIDVKGLPISSENFIDHVAEMNKVDNAKKKVGFFVGCFMNHTMADTGHSVVKVLNKNDFDVVIPKHQVCCGTPQYAYGDFETAKKLAKKNIATFNSFGVDNVVTACASCGSMLKHHYEEIFADEPEFLPTVEEFCSKVKDFSEFLEENATVDSSKLKANPVKVTYHDPCHMVRGQGITKQPREVLKYIPRLEFVEMNEADRCCGASGLFQAFFPEISKDISRQKVDNIVASEAELVATSCPACQHRIQGSLRLAGKKQKVVHIADLLAEAYDK